MPLGKSQDYLPTRNAIGGSIQYLGSGDIDATDVTGHSQGTYTSHWAAYNLSYGHAFTDKLSLGLTGKMIDAKIADVSANAFGADFGSMYQYSESLTLAATLTNIGSKLTFLDDGSPLPLTFHFGGAYRLGAHWLMSAEGAYERNGLLSGHFGGQWRPMEFVSLRAGYRTDTLKELSALAGFTTGIGVHAWGQELSYAWVPLGDLGSTQYISLVLRFGDRNQEEEKAMRAHDVKQHRNANNSNATDVEGEQLMQLMDEKGDHQAKHAESPAKGDE